MDVHLIECSHLSFSGTEICVFYLEEGSSRFFRNRTPFIPHYTVSNPKIPQFSNALQHKKSNLLYPLYFWCHINLIVDSASFSSGRTARHKYV